MTDVLGVYFIQQILKLRKRSYQGADRLFFDRVRRKLNEGRPLDTGEENKLKELYEKERGPDERD